MIKCYEKYKQTKNIWYPEVPSHWLLSKVKYVAKTIAGGTPSTDKSEYWDNGDIPWLPSGKLQNCDITTAEKFITEEGLNNSSTKWIKSDTTLIALTGATCANIGFLRFQACANQSVVAIDEFPDKANSRFLFYMLISMRKQILTHQSGGAQAGINDGNVKNLFLVVPPLNEQLKIAQYLDHQTVIIDQLIQQKERLIELLKEKRQAVINEAVTKGLNPNAKTKDSGIEWLGYINTDWKVKKIKHTTFVKGRIGWQNLRADDFIDEGPHLVTGTDLDNGRINWEGCYRVDEERYLADPFIILEENDVLITKDGTIGKVALVRNKPEKATLNSGVFVTRPIKNDYLPEYFFWVLNSEVFSHFYDFNKSGSTIQHLYQNVFVEFSFAIPSMLEQERIVAYLNERSKYFEELTVNINNAILKIKEYRQSLISEVVTGKINVRDWQPNKIK